MSNSIRKAVMMNNLKPIQGGLHFRVADGPDYEQRLVRCNEVQSESDCIGFDTIEEMGLYCVSFTKDNSIHYVLSESERGAIGQAGCGRSYEEQIALEATGSAIRLPLALRGWGAKRF